MLYIINCTFFIRIYLNSKMKKKNLLFLLPILKIFYFIIDDCYFGYC